MTEYRMLREAELVPELFVQFRRRQEITHCWRKIDGQWQVLPAPRTIENWDQAQREFICWCLREIAAEEGAVFGAFREGALKGIAAVGGTPIGSRNQYLPLSFLHVSQELRGQGIGRNLISLAKAFAVQRGAQKLYLSTQPSVETQAFYKAVGCVEAEEYNAEYVQNDPNECQLELSLCAGR